MDYFSILTNAGLSKLIKATANNARIVLTQMGVSDSKEPITQDLTALPNERHKFSINTITQSESDANVLICESVIPANIGGFYIRKVGIYTDDGVLFAVGVVPDSYKPLLSEGSSKDITIKFYLQVDNTANITLKVDNNIVLATRSHVADEIRKLDAKFLPLTGKAADSDKLDGKDSSAFALKTDILGINQTWQDVTTQRKTNVTYTNTTGRPIYVAYAFLTNQLNFACGIEVGGVLLSRINATVLNNEHFIVAIVPNGVSYKYTLSPYPASEKRYELR